jgi:hypothetical protein
VSEMGQPMVLIDHTDFQLCVRLHYITICICKLSPVAVLYTENFNFCSNTQHTVNPWSSDSHATDRPALPAHREKNILNYLCLYSIFMYAINVACRIAFTKRRYLG